MTGSTEAMKHEGAAAPDCGPIGMRDRAKQMLCGPPPGPERRLWWFGIGHGLAAVGVGFCLGLLLWSLPLWSHPVSRDGLIVVKVFVIGGPLGCFCTGGGVTVWRLREAGGRLRLWRRCILALAAGAMAAGACTNGMMFASLASAMGTLVRFDNGGPVLEYGVTVLAFLATAALICLLSGFMAAETARQLREPGR